jgi:hypothetical protein
VSENKSENKSSDFNAVQHRAAKSVCVLPLAFCALNFSVNVCHPIRIFEKKRRLFFVGSHRSSR